jgi:hypothetical protein
MPLAVGLAVVEVATVLVATGVVGVGCFAPNTLKAVNETRITATPRTI